MDRPPFTVSAGNLGDFTFKRMTQRLRLKIEAEVERMCRDVKAPLLRRTTWLVVFLENVVVEAPEGFDLAALDPADAEDHARMLIVEDAWLAEDARFRGRPWPPRAGNGEGTQPDSGVPVPAPVRPASD